jgi:hypothetical protein
MRTRRRVTVERFPHAVACLDDGLVFCLQQDPQQLPIRCVVVNYEDFHRSKPACLSQSQGMPRSDWEIVVCRSAW